MARPLLKLDEGLIDKLASIHCTMEEIASVCNCSVDTLERRYADLIKKAKDKGKSSLRRHQWEAAQKGNTTMLIWLGKQLLGQSDKSTITNVVDQNLIDRIQKLESMPDEELRRLATADKAAGAVRFNGSKAFGGQYDSSTEAK